MTEPSHAVFLSYASQDAEATQRICEALRAAGIEVWFDKSELRGGDAWDRSIRKQIHDCALFVPIISQHTHERLEGYFRREWRLAVERAGDMAENKAFLIPVVIDSTTERDPSVPEKFRELQWTRLPGGETQAAFVERIQRLLSGETASAPDPALSASSALASAAPAARALIRRRLPAVSVAIAAAVLLAVGYFALERLNRSKPGIPGAASIAVLPLANESGEASQQYFSDGLSEDLITALSQFPGLKVIGRTSSFQFRDSKEDSRSIGAKLGVAHLLEGSVRRAGDVVRVSAELIETADGSTLWSERYDRPYKDLFALQDDITRAVAGALEAKLLHGENVTTQGERPPSGNLDAYNAVLQGNFYSARLTEADYHRAIDQYTAATRLDPRYALAWSSLAGAWTNLAYVFLGGTPAKEAYAQARTAANTALALAPDLADAHIVRGWILQNADLDWNGAEAEVRRALQLAPNDSHAKFSFGNLLATRGQIEPAIDLTRQALAADPLHASWYAWLGFYLTGLNRLAEAEAALHKAIELQPDGASFYQGLATVAILRGDAQSALAAAQHEAPGTNRKSAVALARQIGSDRAAADAALHALIDEDAESLAYTIAEVYAVRNEADNTFAWLDRAWTNRDSNIAGLLYDPFILRYKDDPRFAAFCRKVGLPVPGEAPSRKST